MVKKIIQSGAVLTIVATFISSLAWAEWDNPADIPVIEQVRVVSCYEAGRDGFEKENMEEIDHGNGACAPTSFLLAHSRTDNIADRQLPITAFENARR